MDSIYSTLEAHAWARGFSYSEYRKLKEKETLRLNISEKTYELLCVAFENQLVDDLQPEKLDNYDKPL